MRYFDSGTSIKNDECARNIDNLENDSIFNYYIFNAYKIYGDCTKVEEKIKAIANEYPNLRYRIGYGHADACHAAIDSSLKNSVLTHGPEKIQLFSRNFVAGPDLSNGLSIPQIESQLQQGHSSTCEAMRNGKMAEVDFDRFTPFGSCLQEFYNSYHKSLPDKHSIGENSRSLMKDQDFVKKCGFYRK